MSELHLGQLHNRYEVSQAQKALLFLPRTEKDAAGPRHNTWVISYESTLVNCLKHMGIMPGATSRGSPTFARAALSITSLKPILLVICLCGSSWGVESDEEAAVNSAIGRSSLTSGFTIWSSTGCDFFSVQRQMALARSFNKPEIQLHFANSAN